MKVGWKQRDPGINVLRAELYNPNSEELKTVWCGPGE